MNIYNIYIRCYMSITEMRITLAWIIFTVNPIWIWKIIIRNHMVQNTRILDLQLKNKNLQKKKTQRLSSVIHSIYVHSYSTCFPIQNVLMLMIIVRDVLNKEQRFPRDFVCLAIQQAIFFFSCNIFQNRNFSNSYPPPLQKGISWNAPGNP